MNSTTVRAAGVKVVQSSRVRLPVVRTFVDQSVRLKKPAKLERPATECHGKCKEDQADPKEPPLGQLTCEGQPIGGREEEIDDKQGN